MAPKRGRPAANNVSPVKPSSGQKKARVSETPESIALSKLLEAFDGEVGTMLPESVVAMVKSVADKCLMTPVENRDALETKFASVVGQSLEQALEGLKTAHKDAIESVKEEQEKVDALQLALESANTLKGQADAALAEAQEAQQQATEKKSNVETELENHTEEENGLQPKKQSMEAELASLKEVKDTLRGPAKPDKKDVQKLQKALKEVSAPESLILGVGAAIGKQNPTDQHFVGESAKLLYDKSAQIEGELAKFSETVAEYAKKTTTLRSTVDQLTNDLNERDTDLIAAKKKQKDCIAAIKEAEKQKKQGDKLLEKATFFKDEKESAENVGVETKTQYTFLLERSGAAPIAVDEEVVEAS